MYRSIVRILSPTCVSHNWVISRSTKKAAVVISGKYATDQLSFVQTEINNECVDWPALKTDALSIPGSLNEKNIDAVLLKQMVATKKLEAATSFAEYLKKSNKELSIGIINGLLGLYFAISKTRKLTEEEKKFILKSYNDLYAKHKVLDVTTCERLLHALCAIDEWKKAGRVLSDIHLSGKPSHSAYSTLISVLFRNNKKTEAMKLVEESVNNSRPLRHDAYEGWINYVLTKYKDKKIIQKHLENVCQHVSKNWVTLSSESADVFNRLYTSAGWTVSYTQIRRLDVRVSGPPQQHFNEGITLNFSGECMQCKEKLTPLQVTENEFQLLQKVIKEKLIVGSDLFLKTSPDELKRFLQFIEKTGPYDIVIDALNVVYSVRGTYHDKLKLLHNVVDYFKKNYLNILLLGRKHMQRWSKQRMQELTGKTPCFFTDDLSQDDPFFITAAILSGSHTDIVSKDLLRGHRFQLQDEQLRIIFRRWQWQHQWMVFINKFGKVIFQEPLKFDPYAQKNNDSWHIPFQSEQDEASPQVNDGTPNLTNWICLRPQSLLNK